MVRRTFELANGKQMEYELFLPATFSPEQPTPFVVSVPGVAQMHMNGFSQRLPSESWAVAVPCKPTSAPLLFQGQGAPGDGVWHLRELCRHLLEEYKVDGGRFLMAGVSNGGSSVLRFATLWPSLVCGLIVVTGSLQSLVELPRGLALLRGIPIDMYVGSKDESFYEPMKALDAHLRAIGHQPAAQLHVFRDAGHSCSPLIDDFLLHAKIRLMLLRAGVLGSRLSLSMETETRLLAEEAMSSLCAFSEVLGLQWKTDGTSWLEAMPAGAGVAAISTMALLERGRKASLPSAEGASPRAAWPAPAAAKAVPPLLLPMQPSPRATEPAPAAAEAVPVPPPAERTAVGPVGAQVAGANVRKPSSPADSDREESVEADSEVEVEECNSPVSARFSDCSTAASLFQSHSRRSDALKDVDLVKLEEGDSPLSAHFDDCSMVAAWFQSLLKL